MKKILFIAALITATVSQSFGQNTALQSTDILTLYYNIKDALVTGNTALAVSKAKEFEKSMGSIGQNALPEAIRNSLTNEANQISSSKDVKVQRAAFANLSNALLSVAKTEKISTQPVYQLYCPMKKSYWLSSEKAVKNPYYGSSMLTCGEVVGTI